MSEWREVKLIDFMKFNPSEALAKGTIAKKIAMENLEPFNKKVQGYIEAPFNGGTKFRNGDTLLARITPCLENGKTAYVDFLLENEVAFGSTEYIVLREKKGISNSRFIFYLATSEDFRDAAIQLMTGTSGRQRVETDALKERMFMLPQLPEQNEIAEVLSSLDDKIDFLKRQIKTLENLAETYFRQWFFEEADEKTAFIKDYGRLENSGVNPKMKPNELFYHYSIPAYDASKKPVVELGKEILSNKFKVPNKVILVSKLNPITPRIWAVPENQGENSVCSTEFQVIRPIEDKYFCYLYFLLKSQAIVSELAMSASGTSGSHQRIRPEYILNIEMAKPQENRITEFNDTFGEHINKIESNLRQIQTLQKLRYTLLPKLISGEIRVKM